VVAQFTTNSPLQGNQIAYAIGAGRREQRYCDASFKVLPHRWDVRGKRWADESVVDARSQCFGCHVTGYDATTQQWSSAGVTCEACHGSGSLHAQSGGKTKMLDLRSLPLERQAMICGQCHSDGWDPAKVHPFPVGFRPGENLNNSFVQAAQPRPGPKYSELLRSKHSQMNVICTDCHNPHGPVHDTAHQLLKPVNELCTECHVGLTMAQHAPKAPADTTCATCHMPGGSHSFKTPINK
jgi:predicted CXXCH cytochrome family protein